MSRNNAIDICRLFFAYGVVAIHNSVLVEYGERWYYIGTYLFTRFAVPFFFMVSGYYFYKNIERFDIKKTLIKLVKLFLFWNILYFPTYFYMYERYESVEKLIFDFFLNGMATQLWYLPALIFATFITYWLARLITNEKIFFVFGIGFYIVACLLCSYYSIGMKIPIIQEICVVENMHTYRGNFIMAPAFYITGCGLVKLEKYYLGIKKTFLLLVISCVLYLLELNFIISNNLCEYYNDLVITPMMLPCLVLLMLLLIHNPLSKAGKLGTVCRYIANFTFYFHMMLRKELQDYMPALHTRRYILICFICTTLALILYKINNKQINKVIV